MARLRQQCRSSQAADTGPDHRDDKLSGHAIPASFPVLAGFHPDSFPSFANSKGEVYRFVN